MTITVSIVLHKTKPDLIFNLAQSLSNEPVERIFFIDNSPDNSLSNTVKDIKNSVYLHVPNKGYGNAHNIAINKAFEINSDYHLVLNPDVHWNSTILPLLVQSMESDKECALVQPRVVYPDGTLQHTARLLPTPYDVFAKRFLPKFFTAKRMKKYLLPESAYQNPFNGVYFQGSFLFFKTDALKQVGLFDERFFMYPEDIDISRRIRSAGFSAIYVPHVTIVHNHAAASAKWGKMMWIHIKNMIRYFNKWGWFFDSERKKLNRRLINELKLRQH